jgi:pSer/pThr/pTyr-binding forkhead associated (FHA) protein
MGGSCLVFTGTESTNFVDGNRVQPKRRRLETIYDPPPTEAQVYLSNDKMTVDSTQEPIVIGSHMVCDFIIPEKTVRPFHAILYWAPDGIYVEPMGNFRIQVSGKQTDQPMRLQTDDEIVIGSERLKVQIYGEHQQRCQELYADGLDFENFCLTPLGGVVTHPFIVPAYGGAITIGRASTCGIVIPDLGISRAHAQIIPSGKSFHLIDNYSANGTYVNNEKISKARVHAGDVIEIGKAFFVVHYS